MRLVYLTVGLTLLAARPLLAAGEDGQMPPLPDTAMATAVATPVALSPSADTDPAQELENLRTELEEMRTKNDTLMERLDALGSQVGLLLHGRMSADSIRLFSAGPGEASVSFWPIVGTVDLDLQAQFNPRLQADVVYRMRFLYGGFSGSLNNAGIRSFWVKGDYPLHFKFGTIESNNTPLTLWPAEDDVPYEAPQLASRRAQGMDEQLLEGDTWPLQGLSMGTALRFWDKMEMDIDTLGTRLAIAGTSNSALSTAVIYPYDQYLFGGHVVLKATKNSHWTLGGSYFEIAEDRDTANPSLTTVGVQLNQVWGVDASFHASEFRAEGEFASAIYTPDYGGSDAWTSGDASRASMHWTPEGQDLELSGLYVDPSFINYAAQTRVQDTLNDGLPRALTYNNLLNPSTGDYGYSVMPYRFLTEFNGVIMATNQGASLNASGQQRGGVYLSYDPAVNNSLPYGQATPDREGGALHYSATLMDGNFKPSLFGSLYQEVSPAWYAPVSTGTRTFTRGGAGFDLGLRGISLPLTLTVGVVYENTQAENYVALTSVRSDVGLDWEFVPGWHSIGSFEQRDWNGADFYNMGFGNYVWTYEDMLVQVYGGALEYRKGQQQRYGVDFLTTQGESATTTGAFHTEELAIYASVQF